MTTTFRLAVLYHLAWLRFRAWLNRPRKPTFSQAMTDLEVREELQLRKEWHAEFDEGSPIG